MNRTVVINIILAAIVATILSQRAVALAILLGDSVNGGKVLDEKCTGCHINMFGEDGSQIYTREDHKVRTIEGLMQRVEVCNTNTQNGTLSADVMDDITAYLNETYYQFDD